MQQNPSDQPRMSPGDSGSKEKAPASSTPPQKKSSTGEQPSRNKPLNQLSPADDRTTGSPLNARFQLAADEVLVDAQTTADAKELPKTEVSKPETSSPAASKEKKENSSIIVAPGPGGVMIASDDEEALNQLNNCSPRWPAAPRTARD